MMKLTSTSNHHQCLNTETYLSAGKTERAMLLASPVSFFSFFFLGVLPHIHDHHHYILCCYEALNKQSCSWTASFRVADSTIMVFCICIYTHVAIIDTLNSTICCRKFDLRVLLQQTAFFSCTIMLNQKRR